MQVIAWRTVSEMTCSVSSGTLNLTHSLTQLCNVFLVIVYFQMAASESESVESVKPAVASSGVERCRGPDCDKPVKPGSVYCTEACIHAHAQQSLQLLRQERSKNVLSRPKSEVCD